jgi:hypothetical protein
LLYIRWYIAIRCEQERDAAIRFVKEACPDAEVTAEVHSTYPNQVWVEKDGEVLVQVQQRDLYSKYGWPAQTAIKEAVAKIAA